MKNLADIEFSTAPQSVAQENFAKVHDRLWYLKPSSPATAGPPTSGAWEMDELWIDTNRIVWRCITAGTPGAWVQAFPGKTTVIFEQAAPATTWGPFTHDLGVIPTPTVLIGGRAAGANVALTITQATVTLDSAQSGTLILRS